MKSAPIFLPNDGPLPLQFKIFKTRWTERMWVLWMFACWLTVL